MENRVISWIVNWFEENSDADSSELKRDLNFNYFEQGWLDSFKFISLLQDLEDEFNLELGQEQFLNRDFSSIQGLSSIVESYLEK